MQHGCFFCPECELNLEYANGLVSAQLAFLQNFKNAYKEMNSEIITQISFPGVSNSKSLATNSNPTTFCPSRFFLFFF